MGISILIIICIMLLFGFGEKLLRGTGISSWLAFILSGVFIVAFFIPELHFKYIVINVAGFILPMATSILFAAMSGRKFRYLRVFFAMIAITAEVFGIRLLCLNLHENAVLVATLVSGFLAGLIGYFVAGEAQSLICSVTAGVVPGDLIFALTDYYIYNADAIYLGVRGSYNTIIIGVVFGLILSGIINAIIRTFNLKRVSKHLTDSESAEDMNLDRDEEEEFNEFFR